MGAMIKHLPTLKFKWGYFSKQLWQYNFVQTTDCSLLMFV